MSAKAQSNWVAMALVAVVSAAIGFGAIYVIVGGGDNRGEREAAAAAGSATAQRASESTAEPAPRRVSGAVLTGADGAPLNRGKMTTFVFKQAPAALQISPGKQSRSVRHSGWHRPVGPQVWPSGQSLR